MSYQIRNRCCDCCLGFDKGRAGTNPNRILSCAGQRFQLLVALDSGELTKNQVVNFLDEVFDCNAHNRSKWAASTLFCMSKADKLLRDKNYQQTDALKDFLSNYHEHGIHPYLVYNDPKPSLEEDLQKCVESDGADFCRKFEAMSEHIARLDDHEKGLWEEYETRIEEESHAANGLPSQKDLGTHKTFKDLKDRLYEDYQRDVECQPQAINLVACD